MGWRDVTNKVFGNFEESFKSILLNLFLYRRYLFVLDVIIIYWVQCVKSTLQVDWLDPCTHFCE